MNTAQVETAPVVATQTTPAIQLSAAAEENRKALEAMVAAVAVADPGLQGKLNVQIVWHFLQAPDSCFGWSAEGKMPMSTKMLCVAACLKLGFMPGLGHVIWLGNKPYVTAEGLRLKANSDPDWVYLKAPKLRPMSPDEKDMYQIEQGDMAGVVEAVVKFKGETLELEGVGIIEKGDNRPGSKGKKDRAMKLKTFAERDMLRRYYPVGVSVAGEGEEEEDKPALRVVSTEHASALLSQSHAADIQAGARMLDFQTKRLKALGVTQADIEEYLGGPIVEISTRGSTPEQMIAQAEALADWKPAPTLQPAETIDVPATKTKAKAKKAEPVVEQPAAAEEPAETLTLSEPSIPPANVKAVGMAERLLLRDETLQDESGMVAICLNDLKGRRLKEGDDILVAQAWRLGIESKGKDLTKFRELEKARPRV